MKKYHSAEINSDTIECSTPALDEWSALATFLADMIEKYADVLEVDKMETASRISDVKVPAQKNENPQISVENVDAA